MYGIKRKEYIRKIEVEVSVSMGSCREEGVVKLEFDYPMDEGEVQTAMEKAYEEWVFKTVNATRSIKADYDEEIK